MKKMLLLSILGVAAVSSFAQGGGYVTLDNYTTYGPDIRYGFYAPANGVSGGFGTPGTGLLGGWTVGLYYAIGNVSISEPASGGMPNIALSLATGAGSTVSMYTSAFNTPGEFLSPIRFNTGAPVGSTITAEVVVYDTAGGSYASALYRTHSATFTMPTVSIINPNWSPVGNYMQGFIVPIMPEPSTFALAGLGGLSLLAFRRRNKT